MATRIGYTEGQSLGECTFIREDGHNLYGKERKRAAIFKCRCGKEFRSTIIEVKSGRTTSCGCGIGRIEKRSIPEIYVDGKVRTEYNAWMLMRGRCYDKDNSVYKHYGGRGITVCDRWRDSFLNFFADVGVKPTPEHSLDRWPDKNGNYCPENIRWATQQQQMRNTRSNRILEINGKSLCLTEWAEIYGLPRGTIINRLRAGLSPEQAVSKTHYKRGERIKKAPNKNSQEPS